MINGARGPEKKIIPTVAFLMILFFTASSQDGGCVWASISKSWLFSLFVFPSTRMLVFKGTLGVLASLYPTPWIDLWSIVTSHCCAGCRWILTKELISHQSGRVSWPPLKVIKLKPILLLRLFMPPFQGSPRTWWFWCAPSPKWNLVIDPQLTGCCSLCLFPCNSLKYIGCSRILHLTHQPSSPCLSWRGNLRRRGRRYSKIWAPFFIMFLNPSVG